MADAKSESSENTEIDQAEIVEDTRLEDLEDETFGDVAEETVEAHEDLEPVQAYEDPDERHPSLSSRVLTWLVLLLAGGGLALWGAPKLAPQLPEWASPAAKFLTPGGDAAIRDVAALRAEVTEQLENAPQGPSSEELTALIDAQMGELQATTDEKISALEAQLAAADTSTMDARIATMETQVEGLSAELGALTSSVQTSLAEGGTISEQALADITSKSAEVEGLKAQLGEMTGQIGTLTQRVEDAETAATARVEDAKAEAEQAREQAAKIASNSAYQAALDALTETAAGGAPYAAELESFTATADGEVPAILSDHAATGVAPLAALKDDFTVLSHQAIRASIKAGAAEDGGSASKFGAFLKSQVATRSLGPVEGDGTDAVLSRVNAALSNGDLATVTTEAEALSEEARAPLADWLGSVETRKAVLETLATLASQPS